MLDLTKTPVQKFSKKLASIKWVQLIINDVEKCSEYKTQTKINYLLSSYNVFLIASFEVFLKDMVDHIAERLTDEQKHRLLNELHQNRNLNISSFESNLINEKTRFHTCTTENIDRLFRNVFNLNNVSDSWTFAGLVNSDIKKKVNDIYRVRGNIVHTTHAYTNLTYAENYEWMEFIFNIAGQIQYNLLTFLNSL